nr:unnamed protein product [Digitaria exilis]
MWRGANNGVRVVVDGEVHVERVEKIEAVAVDGVPSPTTATAAARVVLPPPGKAAPDNSSGGTWRRSNEGSAITAKGHRP